MIATNSKFEDISNRTKGKSISPSDFSSSGNKIPH
jgi:hypothetical protein